MVVSGSSTPTKPLPSEASPFSLFICVKFTSNDVALTFGTLAFAPELPPELLLPDEPQPAAMVNKAPARPRPSNRLCEFPIAMPSHCHGQSDPPPRRLYPAAPRMQNVSAARA